MTIYLDTETTGLGNDGDRILELAIVDGNDDILINQRFKPGNLRSWPGASRIHGIYYNDVRDCPLIKTKAWRSKIQNIIDNADKIIGYNVYFDLEFLEREGIKINYDHKKIEDVMQIFAKIYGEWSEWHGNYKYQKLSTCARYYGYNWTAKAHGALADTLATKYCYKQMIERFDY